MSWGQLAWFLDLLRGPKCRYGCGQRIPSAEYRDAHESDEHRGDILPDWTTS